MKERRKNQRQSYGSYVTYSFPDLSSVVKTCCGGNICAEGISLHFDNEVEEGTAISLSFLLESIDSPISATGIVIWCQRIDDDLVHVGVAFEDISAVDQARIISHVVKNFPDNIADFV